MTTWAEIEAEVFTLTNRPDRQAETTIAVRNAFRTAHKAAKFWRDLTRITVTPPTTTSATQDVDLASAAPRLRGVAYLKSAETDKHYNHCTIEDLLDAEGYARYDIYYGMGSSLRIRAGTPETSYELAYYQYPILTPVGLNSWIAEEHSDLIVLWAASSVLAIIGEQEIKGRLDQLAAVCFADLIQDNVEIRGS